MEDHAFGHSLYAADIYQAVTDGHASLETSRTMHGHTGCKFIYLHACRKLKDLTNTLQQKGFTSMQGVHTNLPFRSLPSHRHFSHAPAVLASETVTQNAGVDQSPERVTIPIDGTYQQFSALLLRDACSCPLCVHESTNQRLFSTADIPATLQARNVNHNTAQDSVTIKWSNDAAGYNGEHSTTFDIAALRQLSQTGTFPVSCETPFGSPALWSEKRLEIPDYDYDLYMQDDRALFQLMKQLHTHGLAFVTDIPSKESSLATIATRMGPIKDTFYGQTWDGKIHENLSWNG